MKLRYATTALALSAVLLAPAGLQAQFTTFVPKPTKAAVDSSKPAIVAAVRARSDSIKRMSITNMKEWVDSAAGVSANDTSSAANIVATQTVATTSPASPSASTPATTTTFSNGAIAPNTASPLPAYLAAGLASLTAGLLLLYGLRRRPAAVSAKRRR